MSSSTCISSNPDFKIKPKSRFSIPMDSGGDSSGIRQVTVVDSKSCRQIYLRTAYTFTRQEDYNDQKSMENAKKCLGRVRDIVYKTKSVANIKGIMIFSKVKEFSYVSILCMIRRMLSCTAKVDVIEH
ncbi:unnamed protein product [Amaranthus hypochondriacus]